MIESDYLKEEEQRLIGKYRAKDIDDVLSIQLKILEGKKRV